MFTYIKQFFNHTLRFRIHIIQQWTGRERRKKYEFGLIFDVFYHFAMFYSDHLQNHILQQENYSYGWYDGCHGPRYEYWFNHRGYIRDRKSTRLNSSHVAI